ncbi:hypothetical protein ABZU09_07295 [Lactobacillus mulieris]|jgi:hypothetical protein|uniref:Uncharacterized protein n=2 Tax=Lactobacillus mulieris TaxID=2508708 RepID=A0AAP3GWM1_9LACO|nr:MULTISPECIES: hypothetical protein [Lactobacillus]EEU21457.1 hypothetical protein HMPREF0525_00391 [Lactobacillus jensenii 27-2-CHN]EFH29497.1 hypothetical protein HMPREF0526_11100 [Lactobacillus jensenii JV-V16]KAA9244507.1 hypothetical protein F6I33_03380 [Lactobacillus jensenii]KAA9370338.1 hypothetical protein F6I25_00340 [Lactobacillus jensenii]MCF1796702.1 hypothetical protein [Lactobacillus mulieris]
MAKLQLAKKKILEASWIKKLNSYSFMPVIWWTLLLVLLAYGSSLLQIKLTWRVGFIFIILNSLISYQVGKVINDRNLKKYWLLFLPIVFLLVVLSRYAKYNLVLIIIYLIMEFFGSLKGNIYKN